MKTHVSLANFTTWKVGGNAQWLAEPTNIEEIKRLLAWANQKKLPCHIIGAGSNLLISDCGLDGLSICLRKFQGSQLDPDSGIVHAYAGEPLPSLARRAAKRGLHGLEWSVGIPGTIGGAALMNAGAQGSCTADWIESVQVISIHDEKIFEISKKDLDFGYRYSLLQKEEFIVLSARFRLETGHDSKKLIHQTSQNLIHRTTTQPYHLPSCGSVFRNPEPLKAGRIIEELGLKGHRIGEAEVSTIHANFIVNTGTATAKEIQELIRYVQKRVKESHGFLLHPEVKEVGFVPKV